MGGPLWHTPMQHGTGPTFCKCDASMSSSGRRAEGGRHRPYRTATSNSWSSQYLQYRHHQQAHGQGLCG